jgi:2-polyprenyl-6-methoxyphenol hydroxylase-like FAD-dependent oxidoreductase
MAANGAGARPILIAGGGIAGLATALALARTGRPAHVLEQSPEFREVGAGIQLAPNVFKMFERLGLTEAIDAVAVYPDNLVMMDGLTGEEVTRVPLTGMRARFGYPYAVIHRGDLLAAILAACRQSNLITLETSRKVAAYQDRGDRVVVTTETGEHYEGAAAIGCDGLWSQFRAELIGDGAPRVSGHVAYRAVLPTEEFPEAMRRKDVVLWAGPKNHLVHYPLRRGELYNLVAVFHSQRYEEGWNAFGDPGELREHFRGNLPEVRALLDKIEAWRMWVLCDREPARHWARGRVALLGDAAHPMLQYLAQGACMAIEDAVELAGQIERAGDDLPAAFSAYVDARYLRTARVQIMARVYGEFYHAAGVTRELRNLALGARTPDEAIEGSAWLYGGP